jgi:FkbM family methyltransferase
VKFFYGIFLFSLSLVWGDVLSEFSGMSEIENQELKAYIAHFPHVRYGIYDIPGVGSFFVDPVRDFIKDRLRQGIAWETHIIALLQQHVRQGSVVIDLGAHVGTHTVTMSQCVGPKGRVFAFEPQKKIYRELLMNLQLNQVKNVTTFRYALGNEEQQVQMGFSPPGNEGGTAIGSGGDVVSMKRLDSFSFHDVSLIKIDVEGYEDEVLLGSKETIMRERPVIVIEIMGGHVYEHASAEIKAKIERTISLLTSFGYSVLRLEGHDYFGVPL